jgi:hypothetical protein
MKPDELSSWTVEGLKRVLRALNEIEETGTLEDWEKAERQEVAE